MKKEFDFYEFTGILLPGITGLIGITLIFTQVRTVVWANEISFGELGLSVILGYILGHLLQALGNLIENIWWKIREGMPTDWIRTKKHFLISDPQIILVESNIETILKIKLEKHLNEFDKKQWYGIVRQIYVAVQKSGSTNRIDIFNGNYGLNRGLASAFIFILILYLVQNGISNWQIEIWLSIAIILSIYRMNRFGCHYARELIIQFIQLR